MDTMNNTKKKRTTPKKTLPICFFGHRRRKLAVLCIQKLKEHLKTTGYQVKFIFGNCGKDEEYRSIVIQAIKDNFGENALHKVFDCPGVEGLKNGLNASMNACLKEAFTMSPVVLRTEDDFIQEHDLDIGPWCDLLQEDEGVCGVRLGQIGIEPECVKPYRPDLNLDWLDYKPGARYPVNNQIFLVTKRIYNMTGWYREDFTIDEAEFDLGRIYRVRCGNFQKGPYPKVLWPHGQPVDLNESPNRIFVHAGASTLGHVHFTENIPERYLKYQE